MINLNQFSYVYCKCHYLRPSFLFSNNVRPLTCIGKPAIADGLNYNLFLWDFIVIK